MHSFQIVKFQKELHSELLGPLTEILHDAYAPLAAMGLRYVATHQPPARTLIRLTEGEGFLVFINEELAGTVTLYPPKPNSASQHYQKQDVFSFGQFAISPQFQKAGLGSRVMEFLEREASQRGAKELSLDTSVHATHLIKMYQNRGYQVVEEVQWSETNYRSYILSRAL